MGKSNSNSPRVVGDQALEAAHSGPGCVSTSPVSGRLDALLLRDLPGHFTYRAIHDLVKPYGDVVRIRQDYDDDCPASRCYVIFATAAGARAALDAKDTFAIPGLRVEVLSSSNIAESDSDYVPNIFERAAEEASSEIHQAPTPRWFVAYYRNGRGNYIRAFQFLQREFGTIPQEDVRRYGKGLLIRAKDLTQARMLLHFRCDQDCMFDSVRPHRTFNYSRGIIFNYDLGEFGEEEIYAMCPPTVQKVWKVRGKGNMIVLTFFGSCHPDYVNIGPLRLRVKTFVDRPLQCFGCYDFGHGRKHCTEAPRCGRCSAIGAHNTDDCDTRPYCFHCRADHQLRSRDCPKYRLEEDVLRLANTNFISLGSARRELAYRLGKSGEAVSYASTLGSRLSSQHTTHDSGSKIPVPRTPSSPVPSSVLVRNQFSVLAGSGASVPPVSGASAASAGASPATPVHAHRSPRRKGTNRAASKRHHSSTDSVELLVLPPSKVSVGPSSCARSGDSSSTPSTVASSHSVERASSASRIIPSVPVDDGMDVSSDTPLVVDKLPSELGRSASQDSMPSLCRDRPLDCPLSPGHSDSGGVENVGSADISISVDSRFKAPTLPSTSSIPVTPRAGPSGLSVSRRITVPSQVAKVKGKGGSLTGTRPPRVSKS